MATNFVKKMANSALSSLLHSETEWDNAVSLYRDDFPSIRLAVVQGMLLWQTSGGVTITLCFGIRQQISRS